jgi:hypothetical protein
MTLKQYIFLPEIGNNENDSCWFLEVTALNPLLGGLPVRDFLCSLNLMGRHRLDRSMS